MHGKLFAHTLLAALCVSTLAARARAQGDALMPFIEGRTTRVVDGDTIVINNAATGQPVRVRLVGTDAPEPSQPAGAESRRRLESLVGVGVLRVEFKFTDRYGQVLGRVYRDGEDINHAQLAGGMAWFRTALINELSAEDRRLFEQTEREARAARRGLWKENAPVAPWDFRRAHKISEDPRDEPPPAAPATRPTKRPPPVRRKKPLTTKAQRTRRMS